MNALIELATQMMISETGGLAYHLILVFSILAALQITFPLWRKDFPAGRRLGFGLTILLALNVILFATGLFVWQDALDGGKWLPLLERCVSLISVAIIVWLWLFPQRSLQADAATIIFGAMAVGLCLFGGLWWSAQPLSFSLGGSWLDYFLAGFAIVLILSGLIFLLLRKPAGWEFGLGMLLILLAGYLFHIFWATLFSSYSVPIRLAELAAFPLLLTLPQRYLIFAPLGLQSGKGRLAAGLLDLYSSLLTAESPQSAYDLAAAGLGRALQVDLCLLTEPENGYASLRIHSAYDRSKDHLFQPVTIVSSSTPLLISALQQNRALRLPASSTSPDLSSLAQSLQIDSAGTLAAIPLIKGDNRQLAIVLLSPYTRHSWSPEDVQTAMEWGVPLAQFLHHKLQMFVIQDSYSQSERTLQVMQANEARSQVELQQAQDELLQLRKGELTKQSQVLTLAAMVNLQQDALSDANKKLQLLDVAGVGQRGLLSSVALNNLGQKISQMHTTLASNKEYTGFLLGESMGVLGAIQRKFIERLRTSNEQVTQQLAEVASILAIDPVSLKPFFESVSLPEVVAAAISVEGPRLRKKKINLQVNLPDRTPALATDPDLLQQILQTILRHAGEVTPAQGEVWLRLVVEGESENPDYVVFQIKDEGGGLPAEDLAIIFKPQSPENDLQAPEKSPVARLIQANRWIEAIHGRFWADNDPGRGCSFYILLQITNPAKTGADDAGGNR